MSESDPLQAGDAAPMELPPGARRMLRVVYIMGVILVLLFLTLVLLRTRTEIRARRLSALLARERLA